MSVVCGGFGGDQQATAEAQEVLNAVKAEIETHLARSVGSLTVIIYKTQVVAGVNYLVKAKADEQIIHVKIAKPLPHTQKPPFVLSIVHEGLNHDSSLDII